MARELALQLSFTYSDKSVTDIMAAVDPKATRTMYGEVVKMAIEECGQSARSYTEMADRYRISEATLRDFRKTIPLRVIDGGGAAAIRHRWPAVER